MKDYKEVLKDNDPVESSEEEDNIKGFEEFKIEDTKVDIGDQAIAKNKGIGTLLCIGFSEEEEGFEDGSSDLEEEFDKQIQEFKSVLNNKDSDEEDNHRYFY